MEDRKKLHNLLYRCKHALLAVFSHWNRIFIFLAAILMFAGFVYSCMRYTPPEEQLIRLAVVNTAESYLGCNESDGSHQKIIDLYNTQESLPRGYEVTYEDSWCAVFGSVIAMELELTEWIPVECSCEQQIQLFDAMGRWIEEDCYLPKPGDYIFYDWQYATKKDSRGWSDHVGIVTEVFGPVIKVIEGNKDDAVGYRYLFLNDPTIRGFGIPDYHYAINNAN